MPPRKDGEVTREGKISARDLQRALLGPIRSRPSDDEREAELGYRKVTISGADLEREFGGPRAEGPQRRDGVLFEGHVSRPGEPPQPGLFNRLTEAREAAGLSIAELAAAAALPAKLIERYETAEFADAFYVPDAHRRALAAALELSDDALWPRRIAGEGLPSLAPPPRRQPPPLTAEEELDRAERKRDEAREARAEARDADELAAAEEKLRDFERRVTEAEYNLTLARQ